jgi:arylsulfate sulfotransferase
MFDNGNYRASPPDRRSVEPFSRAVEFTVDEMDRSVVQSWSYGPAFGMEKSFYADFISDADWLPETGNVLVTPGGQSTATNPAYRFSQIIEVTRGGGRVFDMTMVDDPTTARDYTIYRAERVADIRQ